MLLDPKGFSDNECCSTQRDFSDNECCSTQRDFQIVGIPVSGGSMTLWGQRMIELYCFKESSTQKACQTHTHRHWNSFDSWVLLEFSIAGVGLEVGAVREIIEFICLWEETTATSRDAAVAKNQKQITIGNEKSTIINQVDTFPRDFPWIALAASLFSRDPFSRRQMMLNQTIYKSDCQSVLHCKTSFATSILVTRGSLSFIGSVSTIVPHDLHESSLE